MLGHGSSLPAASFRWARRAPRPRSLTLRCHQIKLLRYIKAQGGGGAGGGGGGDDDDDGADGHHVLQLIDYFYHREVRRRGRRRARAMLVGKAM